MTNFQKIIRVQHIRVGELFGYPNLNYDIPLNLSERLTIIIGPNGTGKTQLLECIYALANGNKKRLRKTPFSEIQIDFDDGSKIKANAIPRQDETNPKPHIDISYQGIDKNILFLKKEKTISAFENNTIYRNLYKKSDIQKEFTEFFNNIQINLNENDSEFTIKINKKNKLENNTITKLPNIPMQLIETQRLLKTKQINSYHDGDEIDIHFAVRDVATQIALRISNAREKYTLQASTLDRSYPRRFVDYVKNITEDELEKKLRSTFLSASRMEELGLLPKDDATQLDVNLHQVSSEKKIALALYADDMQRKLDELDEIAQQIELFLEAINTKFQKNIATQKELRVSSNGLIVKSNEQNIDLEQLSSGEQHLLVLLYNLIFCVQPGCLVLIDEPELSLHPEWQQIFVEDLLKIASKQNFDILLATHSPYIIKHRKNLCVRLGANNGGM